MSMTNETFRLLRTVQGLQQEDVATGLDVGLRTVQRWDAGQKPIPEFAQVWMTDKWNDFLDEIDDFMETAKVLPSGHEVALAMYVPQAEQNDPMTIRKASAMNRALAVCLGLSDLTPVLRPQDEED